MDLALQGRPRRARAKRVIISVWRVVAKFTGIRRLRAAIRGRKAAIGVSAHFKSIVALAEAYLSDLFDSIVRQPPGTCELILSDDGSTLAGTRAWLSKHQHADGVVVIWNSENRGIAAATNAGIGRARAPWIGLLDHDDALAPFAVDRIARALATNPDCRFLFTDEVIADEKLRPVDYFLKPAWDPVLLSGVNYINHLSLYRRDRLSEIGGLRESFQGSQDYDLVLRYTKGLMAHEICHLPYPAYIWRRDGASYSAKFIESATANARRALAEHFHDAGRDAVIGEANSADLHRVRFDAGRADWPLVSVVIPNRNAFPLISGILKGLSQGTDYPNLEIIVIDNGSSDPEVLSLYESFANGQIPFRADIESKAFNFSHAINRGVAIANGSLALLLNNDIEIVDRDWLKEMVSCFDYGGTGIVGCKLLYPDQTIQHAGVIAGLGGYAGHWFIGREAGFPGPMGRLRVRQSLSVVTAACMLVSKACWDATGSLDEEVFPIAYNDVDFCLRAVEKGFRVVWTPFATLIHHESASRGSDETKENIERFNRDKESLRKRHRTDLFEDRAFNPWYSKHDSYPYPISLMSLPVAR
jgi:GT2 family glycosyltransferase